jgi:hypothetical protein
MKSNIGLKSRDAQIVGASGRAGLRARNRTGFPPSASITLVALASLRLRGGTQHVILVRCLPTQYTSRHRTK